MSAALIAVDWGTTSCRAAILDAHGIIVDRRVGACGILHVPQGDFAAALDRLLAGWPEVSVILSGMIGSRQGWIEAPYVGTPAGIDDLAAHLIDVPTSRAGPVRLIPGVMHEGDWPEVMRGEETQIQGVMDRLLSGSGTVVLPGTHSKHATIDRGRIVAFSSFMTGEVFAALKTHTILGRLMAPSSGFDIGAFDIGAFERGVAIGAAPGGPGTFLNRIFSTRTLGLFDRLSPNNAADHLSGIVIGAEIASLRNALAPVVLVGNDDLTRRYAAACGIIGVQATAASPDTAADGAFAIAMRKPIQ